MRAMDPSSGNPRWWEGATLYQVYVRSWLDTNADGYGDLPGVTARLDYLSWLGVAGIWLSPTMRSPDQDRGYDVCDYFGVHPELGTLNDLDTLIAEAAKRDIKVAEGEHMWTGIATPLLTTATQDEAERHRSGHDRQFRGDFSLP